MNDEGWQVFQLDELKEQMGDAAAEYLEFLNVPALSCGLYKLAAGSKDMQAPHDEDEMYIVLEGRAHMRLGDEEREVKPGSVLYVSASMEHSFFEIEEDMTLLAFFSAWQPRQSGG
ncbi:MAG: mannose-6-phosphate isomerase-like protein (cupin superfamily) [Halieaceae bacterium]|jgi:mannose-6-phosphate isomerase-like protein (cupin superfamily)